MNRYLLFYFAWRIKMKYLYRIILLLVAEHTKKACNRPFGLAKRTLSQNKVMLPAHMIPIIGKSATATSVVCMYTIKSQWMSKI